MGEKGYFGVLGFVGLFGLFGNGGLFGELGVVGLFGLSVSILFVVYIWLNKDYYILNLYVKIYVILYLILIKKLYFGMCRKSC